MKTVIVLLATALTALLAVAAPPWENADPKAGKEHHDKTCITCHAKLYGGDGSKIYTRDDRLLSSQIKLMQRVAFCNAQTKSGWSPQQEAEIAAYLNQQFYHFKD